MGMVHLCNFWTVAAVSYRVYTCAVGNRDYKLEDSVSLERDALVIVFVSRFL